MPLLSEFKETLKQIKYRKPQPVFCPKCKNPDLHTTNTFGILPQTYVCYVCGYKGPLALELEENDDKKPDDN